MSKELEALNRLWETQIHDNDDYKLIETALEDYEKHKQILNDYSLSLADFRHACFTFAQFKNSQGFEGVEKKLKALEIIKDKCEFVFDDDTRTAIIARNGIMIPICHWDGEEYDLLKEELL